MASDPTERGAQPSGLWLAAKVLLWFLLLPMLLMYLLSVLTS